MSTQKTPCQMDDSDDPYTCDEKYCDRHFREEAKKREWMADVIANYHRTGLKNENGHPYGCECRPCVAEYYSLKGCGR